MTRDKVNDTITDLEAIQHMIMRSESRLERALLMAQYVGKQQDLKTYGVPLNQRLTYIHWMIEYMKNTGIGKRD